MYIFLITQIMQSHHHKIILKILKINFNFFKNNQESCILVLNKNTPSDDILRGVIYLNSMKTEIEFGQKLS